MTPTIQLIVLGILILVVVVFEVKWNGNEKKFHNKMNGFFNGKSAKEWDKTFGEEE